MSDQQWSPLDRVVSKIAFLAVLLTVAVLILERRITGESILQAIASLVGTAGAWRGSVRTGRKPGEQGGDYRNGSGSGGSPA